MPKKLVIFLFATFLFLTVLPSQTHAITIANIHIPDLSDIKLPSFINDHQAETHTVVQSSHTSTVSVIQNNGTTTITINGKTITATPTPTVTPQKETNKNNIHHHKKKHKSNKHKNPTLTKTPTPSSSPTPTPTSQSTPTPTTPASTPVPTQAPTNTVQQFIMDAINKYRADNNLSPVKTDKYTCDLAKIRAKEISTNFSHDGFQDRIDNKTLPYPSYSLITENIAMTSNYKDVVNMWIKSPGHAENMRRDTTYVCVEQYGNYYAYEGWRP